VQSRTTLDADVLQWVHCIKLDYKFDVVALFGVEFLILDRLQRAFLLFADLVVERKVDKIKKKGPLHCESILARSSLVAPVRWSTRRKIDKKKEVAQALSEPANVSEKQVGCRITANLHERARTNTFFVEFANVVLGKVVHVVMVLRDFGSANRCSESCYSLAMHV
jgi:hypothetical protein